MTAARGTNTWQCRCVLCSLPCRLAVLRASCGIECVADLFARALEVGAGTSLLRATWPSGPHQSWYPVDVVL